MTEAGAGANEAPPLSASQGWGEGRWRSNKGLVMAGACGLVAYIMAAALASSRVEVEVTVFTLAFQAVGYLSAIGLANICYSLGAILEIFVPRRHGETYRRRAYALGFWFSLGGGRREPLKVLLACFLDGLGRIKSLPAHDPSALSTPDKFDLCDLVGQLPLVPHHLNTHL